MSVSNIPIIQNQLRYQVSLPNRAERINKIDNQINANNSEINALENQITAQKAVSTVTKELIDNNNKLINSSQKLIANNEKLIESGERKINLIEDIIAVKKEIIANNEKLLGTHKEHRGLLQESRDLAKESRDLAKESRDLTLEAINCVEKMIAIMMKNPDKYGGLDKTQIQQLPEVVNTKKNLLDIATEKLKDYPKQERAVLSEVAEKIIDRTCVGINLNNLSASKDMFLNLDKNLDLAFIRRDIDKNNVFCMLPFKNYRIAQTSFYNFLDLNIKDLRT